MGAGKGWAASVRPYREGRRYARAGSVAAIQFRGVLTSNPIGWLSEQAAP